MKRQVLVWRLTNFFYSPRKSNFISWRAFIQDPPSFTKRNPPQGSQGKYERWREGRRGWEKRGFLWPALDECIKHFLLKFYLLLQGCHASLRTFLQGATFNNHLYLAGKTPGLRELFLAIQVISCGRNWPDFRHSLDFWGFHCMC